MRKRKEFKTRTTKTRTNKWKYPNGYYHLRAVSRGFLGDVESAAAFNVVSSKAEEVMDSRCRLFVLTLGVMVLICGGKNCNISYWSYNEYQYYAYGMNTVCQFSA